MMLKDTDIMTFGEYKGKMLQEVPAKYLLGLLEEGQVFGRLKRYIEDNRDFLLMEKKNNDKNIR